MVSAEEKHLLKLLLSLLLPVYEAGFGYTDVSGGIANVASALASGRGENKRTRALKSHFGANIFLSNKGKKKSNFRKTAVYKPQLLPKQNNYCCYKGTCDASSAP